MSKIRRSVIKADDFVTVEELKSLFDYNSDTGLLIWKNSSRSNNIGREAGCKHSDGHICIRIKTEKYSGLVKAHRIAWAIYYGEWPKHTVDHEDRVRSHNWITNLRKATQRQQIMNQSSKGSIPYKGVSFSKQKGRFLAKVQINGKAKHLGFHIDPKSAALAYDIAATEVFGKYACTNRMLGLL